VKPDTWSLARTVPEPPATATHADALPALRPMALALWRREWRLALRRRSDVLGVAVFFALVASLLPLAVGPAPALLERLGPGLAWVAALLAAMLSLHQLFASDQRDGTLDLLLLAPQSLPLLVLVKSLAHWATSGLLLTAVAPMLALQYGLSLPVTGVLCLSMLIGTPLLSLIGAVGAALTVGLRGAGTLVTLLVLPLCVPVLVFGAGAADAVQAGLDPSAHLSVLGALLLLALAGCPWAAAQALRIANE